MEGSSPRGGTRVDVEVQVGVVRREVEVEARPEVAEFGQVVGFNGDGSAAVPPGGFSIHDVVTAVAQTSLDVPSYQMIQRLTRAVVACWIEESGPLCTCSS